MKVSTNAPSTAYDENTKTLISYDTVEIARRKAHYIKHRGLGGAMVCPFPYPFFFSFFSVLFSCFLPIPLSLSISLSSPHLLKNSSQNSGGNPRPIIPSAKNPSSTMSSMFWASWREAKIASSTRRVDMII